MSKGKLLAVCVVWLLIAGALAVTYRLVVAPRRTRDTIAGTSSASHYRYDLHVALDSFSGYALLRTTEFKDALAQQRIRLTLKDDEANYAERLRALRAGDTQMAVFTIDALLQASAELGEMPATIVAVIDETRGADAVVAYKDAIPNGDALNRDSVRFVLIPDSPSETLARVVMSHFQLDQLPPDPFIAVADADGVMERYRQSKPTDSLAFVTWEPYVSQMKENPQTHVVVDSGTFRGTIVDVLVVSRDFLLKNEDIVKDVVGSYFKTAYSYRSRMVDLLLKDAEITATPLTRPQAERLVQTIWWKNTLENFAHFGLEPDGKLQLLEDMVQRLASVLRKTGAIDEDPTQGQPHKLYFDQICRELRESNFHPGLAAEQMRTDELTFKELTPQEWEQLLPIGTLSVPELVFARGTDVLTSASQEVLDDLVEQLQSLSTTYVVIRGNAAVAGDPQANQELAQRRASAAAAYLVQAGVDPHRLRAVGGTPQGNSSVSFVLGRLPY